MDDYQQNYMTRENTFSHWTRRNSISVYPLPIFRELKKKKSPEDPLFFSVKSHPARTSSPKCIDAKRMFYGILRYDYITCIMVRDIDNSDF